MDSPAIFKYASGIQSFSLDLFIQIKLLCRFSLYHGQDLL